MLQDEAVSYIEQQFMEKNMILAEFGEEVTAYTLYEDVFGDISQIVPVVLIDDDDKHIVPMSIEDAIEQCESRNDVLLGGCTYFNNWISKKSAKDIYTFIIDMDNVYSGTLLNALQADWKTASDESLPMPTYIVNSGTGLHLYFVLDEPIPNYKATTENLDKLYRALAIQQTTKRVYLQKQVQWFGQDFRMVGGLNKYNWKNTCFRVGHKWNIDELGKAVGLKDVHFLRYGEQRAKRTGERKKKQIRDGWRSNRAFYDYALMNCKNKTKEGNRYTSMCALSVIAWKCGVSQEELERDLLSLLPIYNKDAKRQVKEKEIHSAIKMYNPKAMLTQRSSLEHWQGWEYKPMKRNGRSRSEHLRRARAVQMIDYPNGEWRGNQSKETIVMEYVASHPNSKVSEIARECGVARNTVYKYLNK